MIFLGDEAFRFGFLPAFYLLIPALIAFLWWWRGVRRNPAVLRYSDTRLLSDLPISSRVRLRRIPDLLRALAWIVLIVAFARPQSGLTEDITSGEGINIVIALDISNSMAETDMGNDTSRFRAAKDAIQNFITARLFDQIGLVVFGEQAFYQAPPTLDYTTLVRIVENIPFASEVGLGNRTAVGLGLASSINMLRDTEGTGVIILLTDGVSNTGEIDPISAAEAAAVLGYKVYTVGINTTDLSFPNSPAEVSLRQIATITGGEYFNASNSNELDDIYDRIDRLEGIEIEREIRTNWTDLVWYPLVVALVLLILERLLRLTVFQTIP